MISEDLRDKINSCIKEYEPCGPVFKQLLTLIQAPKEEIVKVEFGQVLKEINNIQAIYPTRKKCTMVFYKDYISIGSAWVKIQDLKFILVLPTPNKTKPHWSLVMTSGLGPELFTETLGLGLDSSSKEDVINSLTSISVIRKLGINMPSETVFVSKGSSRKLSHVDAYLKNKDGVLYFLSVGVFFGFKKPLLFFSNESIVSMHVNCVTGRTFNLNLNLKNNTSWEFSMIDQVEYEGISGFMERFNIQGTELSGKMEINNAGSTLDNMEFDDEESEDEDFKLSDTDESSGKDDGSEQDSDQESDSEHESGQESVSGQESDQESQEDSEKDSIKAVQKKSESLDESESRSEKSVVESNVTIEQENVLLVQPQKKRARKSTPRKITGMLATAEAVKKQLEKTRGKMTSLKRLKKEQASNSKTSDNAIVYVESDIDELED